jgi:hypothetical protein
MGLFKKKQAPVAADPAAEAQARIVVYGTGCKKCQALYANAQAAVAGTADTVAYVTDPVAIAAAGIMRTPAMTVDGVVVAAGQVLSSQAITEKLAMKS